MNTISILVKRNIKLFIRDRATVFFSFLSTLILIMLYFLFIAKMYTSSMDSSELGGLAIPISESSKNFIVYVQMMAGVLVLNSMSLATGVFSTIARDFENKRIDNFLLTPVRTYEMIISYFISGLIASFLINMFTWIVSFVVIGITTGYWLTLGSFFMVLIVLFVASLISSSIMLLVTALVKSSAAIGVVNGVSGTFFGFLCGIYMPYSNLGESTKIIGSFLPFTHVTIWLKQVVLDDALAQVGVPDALKKIFLSEFFSAESIGIGTISAPLWVIIVLCGVFGFLCLIASYILLQRRIKGK